MGVGLMVGGVGLGIWFGVLVSKTSVLGGGGGGWFFFFFGFLY